jgi:tryptophan-rich sensory protein
MDVEARSGLIREARLVAVAMIPVIVASGIGQIATYPNLAPWYAGLVKPAFKPPNWVFGPVWTTLFLLMAFAVWRVLRLRRRTPARRVGLILFYSQLALNAAWSWTFFAAHSPALGLVNIVPQLLVIAATVIAFWRLDRIAGWSVGAAPGLGRLRYNPEFRDLVAEWLMMLGAGRFRNGTQHGRGGWHPIFPVKADRADLLLGWRRGLIEVSWRRREGATE